MARLGMDVDEVRNVASNLHSQSGELNTLISKIESLVNKAVGVWDGPDSRRFHEDWASKHRPALQRLSQEIEQLSSVARTNAAEQENVSR
ncbi:MAG: WXG100 family type VII secretion target [Tetrasphaera sp.]|jgi:WXG100 family type VII secretion target|nr:WXG100 family type VII secretion target [Tetrasphaera sp.]